MVKVLKVGDNTPEFEAIKLLWRANKDTLGFFPDGAFAERAQNGQILGAFADGQLIGYTLYFTDSRPRVRLTHLCIAESHRGQGIARILISALSEKTKTTLGIGLFCRRDFPAWKLWPRLGFQAVKEKTGRSRDGHELTYFWLPHSHKNLFSDVEDYNESLVRVVIDANVFYDLYDPSRMEAEESVGLTADWLQPSICLCVTPELSNEIQQNQHSEQRKRLMGQAQQFELVEADGQEQRSALVTIESICGLPVSNRDAADQRQLSWAIASDADVFVTRDQGLLSHSDNIYREFGLLVQRPSEVIARFEELRNEHEYQRDRLAGTDIQVGRHSGKSDELVEGFLKTGGGEKKHELTQRLHSALALPERFVCKAAYKDSKPICLYVFDNQNATSCTINTLRLRYEVSNTRLGRTMIRTVLAEIVANSANSNANYVQVTEPLLDQSVLSALREGKFFQHSGTWTRLCLKGVVPHDQLHDRVSLILSNSGLLGSQWNDLLDCCAELKAKADPVLALKLEEMLWPVKITGTGVKSYVVPIKLDWANYLFDGALAKKQLWGADPELALNPDSVFYRAVKPRVFRGTGRILWYVSNANKEGGKMIRACSRVTAVHSGRPKDLFRRFRRFGVYAYEHVVKAAKREDGEVMAIEFTDTELFKNPLRWDEIKQVLRTEGKENYTFPSPVEISETLFTRFYCQGNQVWSES